MTTEHYDDDDALCCVELMIRMNDSGWQREAYPYCYACRTVNGSITPTTYCGSVERLRDVIETLNPEEAVTFHGSPEEAAALAAMGPVPAPQPA